MVVRDGTEVVGLLPLSHEGGTLSFLATRQSDYNDLLAEAASAGAVLQVALEALLSHEALAWRACVLQNVPEDSNLAVAIEGLPLRLRGRLTFGWADPCPTLVLGEDREQQLRSLTGKSSLKRHHRKLARRGNVVFRHIEDRAEARSHLPAFFRQHIRRRAMADDTSQMLQSEQRDFYERLIEELDPATTLRFGVLEVDGRPAAYHFGFQSDRKFIWYKPAFDVELWDEGPGEVLVRELLTYCQTAGVDELDFTIGAVGFKSRFANRVRLNQRLIFRRSWPQALAWRSVVRSRDWVVRRPRVRRWFREGRALGDRARALRAGDVVRGVAGGVSRDEDQLWALEVATAAATAEAPAIRPGTLGDFVDLSVLHPGEISAGELHRARRRLKDGERLLLGVQDDEITHLAWLAGPEEGPSPLIHDSWVAPAHRDDDSLAVLLGQVAALSDSPTVYATAPFSDGATSRALERAGFAPALR